MMTIFYEVASPVTDDLTSHVYAAKIVGSDPNFVLRRVFQPSERTHGRHHVLWTFELPDGVYEIGISIYDRQSGDRVHRIRKWLVVFDEEAYEYDYAEMTAQYVIYTAWCIRMQNGGQA